MVGLTGGWVGGLNWRRKQSPWPGRVCLEIAVVLRQGRDHTLWGTIPICRDCRTKVADSHITSVLGQDVG